MAFGKCLRSVGVQLLAVPLLCVSQGVAAESVACGDKPIHLAFFDYGLRYFVDKGQARGIDKEFVDALQARSGCRFVTEVMTKSRIYADLVSGSLDMSPAGVPTPEREARIWFIPALKTKFLFVVNQQQHPGIRSAADFLQAKTLVLGVIRGAQYGAAQQRFVEDLRSQNRVDESKDVTVSIEKYRQGQIDALLSTPSVYRMHFNPEQTDPTAVVYDWFPEEPGIVASLMLSKTRFSPPEAAQWRNLLRAMHRDGTLERINARYVSKSEARQMAEFAD